MAANGAPQNTVSVTNPKFYARRFTDFMHNRVFKALPEEKCARFLSRIVRSHGALR